MQEIFNANIPVLYERILGNQVLLTVAQHFLANASKSRYFADTLLRFLVDRLEQLGDADKLSSAVTVRRRWAGGAGRVRGHGRLTVTLQFPGRWLLNVAFASQLRLYKLVFGSVALFAEQDPSSANESILQPHLSGIIKTSLKVRTPLPLAALEAGGGACKDAADTCQ